MTSFLRRAVRTTGLTAAEGQAAESVLGRGHRLTRALSILHALALQAIVAVLAVAASTLALFAHLAHGALVLGIASTVAFAFVGAWTVAHRTVRERVDDLIADGHDSVALPVVAHERRRLSSRKARERLARSLEDYLNDARHWTRVDPRSRPPAEIRCLLFARREARDVTRLVRSEAPSPRGVAALTRFLTDGQRSSLFAGNVPRLRWELVRIAALLQSDDSRRAHRAV
jgi:hypothetical protein